MELKALLKKLEVKHEGGTVPNRWINNDIKPIESGRRVWSFWTYHNLWGMCQLMIDIILSTMPTSTVLQTITG